MSVNKELIPNINIFNIGYPGFIAALMRMAKPIVALAKDTIIYRGDASENFYLIKSGEVEIIASDD